MGLCSVFQVTILQGGVGGSSVGRGRGKDIADLGKPKLDQMGAPQPIVWITSIPFLSEHKAQAVPGGMQVGGQAG